MSTKNIEERRRDESKPPRDSDELKKIFERLCELESALIAVERALDSCGTDAERAGYLVKLIREDIARINERLPEVISGRASE